MGDYERFEDERQVLVARGPAAPACGAGISGYAEYCGIACFRFESRPRMQGAYHSDSAIPARLAQYLDQVLLPWCMARSPYADNADRAPFHSSVWPYYRTSNGSMPVPREVVPLCHLHVCRNV